jgi:N-acetylmuramoyl-L-alanine amidase
MKTLIQIFTFISLLSIATFGQTQYSILIDPGHGGSGQGGDPGALGTDGAGYPNEKDITLKLGNDLRDYLTLYNITPNLRTYMTRKTDVYVSPENRAKMAKGEINDAYWVTLPKNGDVF